MPIVVEGPDGSGKTTLIGHIREEFPELSVMPRVVNKDTQPLLDLVEWVEKDNYRPRREAVIYDRHRLVSELIYGSAIRPQPQPGFDNLTWLSTQLFHFYRRQPLIIYCLPSMATVVNNVRKGRDGDVVIANIRRIYGGYVARIALDCLRPDSYAFWYNYEEDREGKRTQFILDRVHNYLKGF